MESTLHNCSIEYQLHKQRIEFCFPEIKHLSEKGPNFKFYLLKGLLIPLHHMNSLLHRPQTSTQNTQTWKTTNSQKYLSMKST